MPGITLPRCASPGTRDAVITMPVIDSTFVRVVEDQNQFPDVQIVQEIVPCQQVPPVLCQAVRIPATIVTKMHKDVWALKLQDHPDQEFAKDIVSYLENGVPLLYDGPILNQCYPNWNSCVNLREEVKTSLLYDIARNWKIGPFSCQPFTNFVSSPMGVFTKLSENNFVKVRVIHDLSWPPEGSVNYFIPADPCPSTMFQWILLLPWLKSVVRITKWQN